MSPASPAPPRGFSFAVGHRSRALPAQVQLRGMLHQNASRQDGTLEHWISLVALDPHLHAPGTLRNDQFGGDWAAYFLAIEKANPPVVALGITDFFTLRGYKELLRRRNDRGGVQSIPLIFPNTRRAVWRIRESERMSAGY
jgi:hypothetical protein